QQGEQGIEVAQRQWRYVQRHRLLARQAEAPAQQPEADQRNQRVTSLPAHLAQPRQLPGAPAVGEDAQGMHAQKHQQAEYQYGHGSGSASRWWLPSIGERCRRSAAARFDADDEGDGAIM